MARMTREDETKYWLSVPRILETIAMSEEDVAADRTYGELKCARTLPM